MMGDEQVPLPSLEPLSADDPRRLGPFRLEGRLGRGGMATAFLGNDGERWAVVKLIYQHLAEDPAFRARLGRELDTMRRVGGGAATVLSQDLESSRPWFAFEYIDGQTLSERVTTAGSLTGQALLDFAVQLAQRIQILHDAGVTHRDIKPSNVILSPQGVRLIDFGIAVGEDDTALTSVGGTAGTLAWSSPEQVTGEEIGPAADVHAWGLCVLYAATGEEPFGSGTAANLMYQVIHTVPETPQSMPRDLAAAIAVAMSKDPVDRPAIARMTLPDFGFEPPSPVHSMDDHSGSVGDGHLDGEQAGSLRRGKRRFSAGIFTIAIVAILSVVLAWQVLFNQGAGTQDASDSASPSPVAVSPAPTSVTATVNVGEGPMDVAFSSDGTRVYVPSFVDGSVSVIEAESNLVVNRIPLGEGLRDVAVSADDSQLFVSNSVTDSLSIVDNVTGTEVKTVRVGEDPHGVARSPDGSKVYVANVGSGSVSVVDAEKGTVLDTVLVEKSPVDIAATTDGTRIYVTNWGSESVSVIDTATNKVVGKIKVGTKPWGVAVTSDGSRAYVVNSGFAGTVSAIDTAIDDVVELIYVGSEPVGIAISPDDLWAYVTRVAGNSVSPVNLMDDTVANPIRVGRDPRGVAISPDGSRVYTANFSGESVSVLGQ